MGSLTGSWMTNLCGGPVCSCSNQAVVLSCALKQIFDSSTCMNHLLVTSIATLLVILLALQLLAKIPKRGGASMGQLFALSSPLHLAGVAFSGCLGLVYLGLGLWMLGSSFNQDASVYLQPHWWLVTFSQGFSLILISFAFSIRAQFLGAAIIRLWSVLLTIYATYICFSSVHYMLADKVIAMKPCLDVLFLLGALLLLVYGIWHIKDDGYQGIDNAICMPLNTETVADVAGSKSHVTPFAKAEFFSIMSFWWLNPLMKLGYEKPREEKDIPLLGATDRAYDQYLMFVAKLNHKKRLEPHGTPSLLWIIISSHKSGIMVSAFFALLKVLTLSSGPLLLKAFINVSIGKSTFKYEGYVLAASLFFCKLCESLSQRAVVFPYSKVRTPSEVIPIGCYLQETTEAIKFSKNETFFWRDHELCHRRHLPNWGIPILVPSNMDNKSPTLHCSSNSI